MSQQCCKQHTQCRTDITPTCRLPLRLAIYCSEHASKVTVVSNLLRGLTLPRPEQRSHSEVSTAQRSTARQSTAQRSTAEACV